MEDWDDDEAGVSVPWLYKVLVLERGWSGESYEQWLTSSLTAALLEPRP